MSLGRVSAELAREKLADKAGRKVIVAGLRRTHREIHGKRLATSSLTLHGRSRCFT